MEIMILQLLVFAVASQAYMCPAPEVCLCEEALMMCTCDKRQDITLNAVLNFDIKHVVVQGCGSVTIPLGAMTHLQLETIHLMDILHLNIRPFAFAGIETISELRITNVFNFDVQQHGFSGVYNVETIHFTHVNAKTVPMGSFGGLSDIQEFRIEDSQFEIVEPLAFILSNITNFKVINSHFHSLENLSLLIQSSETVEFQNTTFYETANNSFSMSYVNTLEFSSCIFGRMGTTTILTKSLETFKFQNCIVEETEPDALLFLEVTDKVFFTGNVIIFAGINSLIPNSGLCISRYVTMKISGNSLTCDCNIAWVWDIGSEYDIYQVKDIYKEFRQENFCIGKVNVTLSMLHPVLNKTMNCEALEHVSDEFEIFVSDTKQLIGASFSLSNCFSSINLIIFSILINMKINLLFYNHELP